MQPYRLPGQPAGAVVHVRKLPCEAAAAGANRHGAAGVRGQSPDRRAALPPGEPRRAHGYPCGGGSKPYHARREYVGQLLRRGSRRGIPAAEVRPGGECREIKIPAEDLFPAGKIL